MIIKKPKPNYSNTDSKIDVSKTTHDIIDKETSNTMSSIFRIEVLIVIFAICACAFIIFQLLAVSYAESGIIESIPFSDTKFADSLKTSIKANFTLIKHSYYSSLATVVVICINICIICECIKSNSICIKKINNLTKNNSIKKDTEKN